jgi:hypothetical protein
MRSATILWPRLITPYLPNPQVYLRLTSFGPSTTIKAIKLCFLIDLKAKVNMLLPFLLTSSLLKVPVYIMLMHP